MPPVFVEEAFDIAIKDGCVIIGWPGGERRSIPLRVFRMSHARADKALREYDARSADVVPIKRRKKAG